MRTSFSRLLLTCSLVGLAACASGTPAEDTGLGDPRGTYVLTLSADRDVRSMFEDRLVADMGDRGLRAFASYPDLPDTSGIGRDRVFSAAKARNALFILVVEEVAPGKAGTVTESGRITPEHPTLRAFFEDNPPPDREYDPGSAVFVEVSAFQIMDRTARLVWSGTTWSFQADGRGGQVPGISATIADAIAAERQRYLERHSRR